MAENQGIKIRIRLKAYDHKVIDQSAKQIIDTAIRTGAEVAGPIPLPTRRSTYTVVKSPHVYKMGGETYEMRVHKRLIDITNAAKIPVICGEPNMVKAGGLATYGIDYYKLGVQTGHMAADILEGKKPGSIPIEMAKDLKVTVEGTWLVQAGSESWKPGT